MTTVREKVDALFLEKFNKKPEWTVRCPGRVNIIGEHIDYSHYSVFPMAIQSSTYVAVGRADDKKIHLENVDDKKYLSSELDFSSFSSQSAHAASPIRWNHYFEAGSRGIIAKLFGQDSLKATGMNIVVGSDIPPSAGLSSSSALVCAAALATFVIQTGEGFNGKHGLDKVQLAEIATKSERFVGTEGGGMDQACECLAERGSALRIDFHPLGSCKVQLPATALFIVVHSGVEMNKAASVYYNERVVECRIAAQIICKLSGKVSDDGWTTVRTLKDAATLLGHEKYPGAMLKYVNEFLTKPGGAAHSRQEVCGILGATEQQLKEYSLNNNTQEMQEFWLSKRANHVFSEAARVFEFEHICLQAAEESKAEERLKKLAALMNQSHSSCREDFECSCPALDKTVEKCIAAGCLAARLTGAGWGGCVVALVDAKMREQVAANQALKILFWSEPSEGIQVERV